MTDLNRVLELVNEARANLGFQPLTALPLGVIKNPQECVIARALDVQVAVSSGEAHFAHVTDASMVAIAWGKRINLSDARARLPLPEVLDEFADEFDEGKFPELVA